MTSKERVLTALEHRQPDRNPFSWGFGLNEPVQRALLKRWNMPDRESLDRYFLSLSDIRHVSPKYIGPADRDCLLADGSRVDIWGVERRQVSYGEGYYEEICHYPLGNAESADDLDAHLFPKLDWFDFSGVKEQIASLNSGGNEYCIQAGSGNIFETAWYMRGFETMLTDLLLEPEFVWALMERITDFFIAYHRKLYDTSGGLIDIVFTADDVGQQEGPLISVALWEELIKPHHKRLNKALHELGVKIMYHTDGAVMNFIPGFLDMGIDVLEALQFDAAGMDAETLKSRYGDRLSFHGGISVQSTLPFGTPSQVEDEVKRRVTVLGKSGGYILAPSHCIQAGTPPENVEAFIRAAGFQLPPGAETL